MNTPESRQLEIYSPDSIEDWFPRQCIPVREAGGMVKVGKILSLSSEESVELVTVYDNDRGILRRPVEVAGGRRVDQYISHDFRGPVPHHVVVLERK